VLGQPGEQAEGKVHHGGINGDDDGQLGSWAHAREKQGVYRPSIASSEDHVWFEDRWMVASWCD
jgi:hypothetical protein